MNQTRSSRYVLSDDPYSSHAKIVELAGMERKVLDVGCWTGYVGKRLVDRGCTVVGIELDASAAAEARRFYERVIVSDLDDTVALDYPEGHFDVIVFSDILEHLKNPLSVLRSMRLYLNDEGFIICSIPNVAHLLNRLMLLMGRWDYQEYGLLDRAHLRHFTIHTAQQLLRDAGYRIAGLDYTAWFPVFYLKRFRLGMALRYHIARMRPPLLALQVVIKGYKL